MKQFDLKKYSEDRKNYWSGKSKMKLFTLQDHFPARLLCNDLKGSAFPLLFAVEEDGREKLILANEAGITGSRDRKYDIGYEE